MIRKVIFVGSIISFFLLSCEATEPRTTNPKPAKVSSDSTSTLKIKPLSTEKTHEGGVDKTKLNFK